MKRVKFLMVFVFLLVGTLTVMAFTNNTYHSSTVINQCLKYVGPQPANDITISNASNWTPYSGNPFNSCNDGEELCVICYDTLNMTPNLAREVLSDWYYYGGSLPVHGNAAYDSHGHVVWVYMKTTE